MLNDAAVSHFKKVYLAPGYTDLRRGIDGLASIVRFQFELDPYDKNTLFLFCGRKNSRIENTLGSDPIKNCASSIPVWRSGEISWKRRSAS